MERRLIIAGNWKMNYTAETAVNVIKDLKTRVEGTTSVDIVVCPTFTSLVPAVAAAKGSNIAIGAQNVHWKSNGAFTGEISVDMLTEIPVTYAIVGHSERRQYFGETDETVNQRLRAALESSLLPIVCVGETLEQRTSGETESVITDQISKCLSGLAATELERTTIAYEPVWAIGTGKTATAEQAQEVHQFIRNLIAEQFNNEVATKVRIQYGGSVKAGNVHELMSKPDIDGALVGGASLKADEFSELIKKAE